MAKIQPVSVWSNGQVKTAEVFNLNSNRDDLATIANFSYELREADVITQDSEGNDVVTPGSVIVVGNINMFGQDYQNWASQPGEDVNTWAYNWAAGQLNLVII